MRIGIVCYPSVGGSGFLATKLGLELAKMEHEVHFFSYETPHLLQTGHLHGIKVHIVDVTSYALFKYPPYTLSLTSSLIEESDNLDIINVHYAIPHAASAFLTKIQTGLPFVVTLHGSDVHTVGPHPAYRHSVSVTLKQADALTSVAQYLSKEAEQNFGISNVPVIPNFVDAEQFTRSKYKDECCIFEPAGYDILHVSNFRAIKRTTDLIKAMSIVKQAIPEVHLYLVGEGPERIAAGYLVGKHRLEKTVTFLGMRRDIPTLLYSSSIFCLPSELEAAPLSILEAMAMEVPVVASRAGGIPEIAIEGETALLCEPLNPTDLAEKLIKLLQNKQMQRTFGEKARERVLEYHDPIKITLMYEKLYEEVLNKINR